MNKFKKFRSVIWGTIVLLLSLGVFAIFADSIQPVDKVVDDNSQITVPVVEVKASHHSIKIPVSGIINVQNRIDLYSEVGGLLEEGHQQFLEGSRFSKGDVILYINSNQFEAELMAQKSSFTAKLISILATIKVDFLDNFDVWNMYVDGINIEQSLPVLPGTKSAKEHHFVISKGIEELYYRIKCNEELLLKYSIIAPFDGVLSSTEINKGSYVNPGQKLSSFVGGANFDVVTDVKKDYMKWVSIKDTLFFNNNKKAIITRIGNEINSNTQTVKVYASICDASLRNLDFVEGYIKSSSSVFGCAINRSWIESGEIYLVKEGKITKQAVSPIILFENKALIQEIEDGALIATKTTSLYDGQEVTSILAQ